jgi:hypothetical protein
MGWGMGVSVSVSRAGTLAAPVVFLLLAAAAGQAQTAPPPANPPPAQAAAQPRPVTGFVSSYEILRTARAAGFDPLAPPLRDGSTYVLRATDFRGILMRVVLDARTGAIRDVTRIVSEDSGPYGMMAPPYGAPPYAWPQYGPPPYAPPPYGAPAEYDAPQMPPADVGAPTELTRPAAAPARTNPTGLAHSSSPPLPRPRPASLALQNPEKTGVARGPAGNAHSANAQPRAAARADTIGTNVGTTPAPSPAPGKPPPPAPFND